MAHDHSHHHAPTRSAADFASAFVASALLRLGVAVGAALVLWLCVAWALGWF